MTFTPFETARLRLRPQEARDAGFALCIWGDPITGKYLSDPVLDDIDDLNEYMELLRSLSDSTDCYYIIAEDKVTHQPIGTCCAVVKDGGSCWDIGYCIHPTCWRKGYAKEMVNALFDFWMPRQTIPIDTYNTVFLQIDQKISCSSSLEETT